MDRKHKFNHLILKRLFGKVKASIWPYSKYMGDVKNICILYIWKLSTLTSQHVLSRPWFLPFILFQTIWNVFILICFRVNLELSISFQISILVVSGWKLWNIIWGVLFWTPCTLCAGRSAIVWSSCLPCSILPISWRFTSHVCPLLDSLSFTK